jgi:hypothetical protein
MLVKEPSCPSHEKIPVDSSEEHEDAADKASYLEILEDAPDDEVEGEMVYLQARLLDNAVVLKHKYGKNICHCFLFCASCVLQYKNIKNDEIS